MIQVHSTWFPFIDRNPQKYVDNIYEADEKDFIKSTIKVLGSSVINAGGQQQLKKGFWYEGSAWCSHFYTEHIV